MAFAQAGLLLLGMLVVLVLGLAAWGVVRVRATARTAMGRSHDDLLLVGLVLAAFSAGAFWAIILSTLLDR